MADVIEIWADTGEVVERDFTPVEIEQNKQAAREREEAIKAQVVISQARVAALAHARSLGFTDEMIAVMYPGLVAAE